MNTSAPAATHRYGGSLHHGTSEKWVAEFVEESGLRDKLVIAPSTRTTPSRASNAGGNNRKNLIRALDGS